MSPADVKGDMSADIWADIWAIVPAAGRGSRFGGDLPKQYLAVAGKPLIAHALDALLQHPRVAGAVVALSEADPHWPGWTSRHGKPVMTCVGGGERGDSVLAALNALPDDVADDALVLVHDAARPNLCRDDLDRLIAAAEANTDGAVLAAPVRDTLKRSDGESRIAATEPRAHLWRALTPQAFRRAALAAALEQARADGMVVTDDAMAMERVGARPGLVEGRDDNLKVTTPADQALVEFLLMDREGTLSAPLSAHPPHPQGSSMRIGQGFDVHAFGEGDHIMLGGVRVPHDRGVVAHSDGDVVIHALCDAMLGALALGDIGRHFPPDDERWKNADSLAFLRHCNALATERGWKLGNADVTVICERPKVGPHALAMRERLAAELGAALDAVSVKATTSEKLGFTGRGEGIAAQAVVVLLPV